MTELRGLPACLSVTLVSPAKMAEPIEMLFGLRTQVGPGNHVLDGVQILHGKGQFFWGGKGRPIVKYRDTAVIFAKMAEPIEMLFGLWATGPSMCSGNAALCQITLTTCYLLQNIDKNFLVVYLTIFTNIK